VPEGRHVFPFLTVRENLELGGFRHRRDAAKVRALMARIFTMFPRLRERAAQNAGTLSGGEQQMLALGRALVLNPRILLLDEPSQGLAPLVVQEVFQVLARLRADGLSILLVEQNVRAAVQIADVAYVLDDGRIVYQGAAAELAADEERLRQLAGAAAQDWSPTPSAAA